MGFLDKAKAMLGQHEEKVEGAIDKVAEVVDEKTGGKYADQIDKGVEKAKGFVAGDGEHMTAGDAGDTPPPAVP